MIGGMIRLILLLVIVALLPVAAWPHGGVVEEDDLCVIKVNYLRGHFKIYQPLIDGHKEYCEDLPNATESVFVMEYLHDSLREATVDFRIIRDVTGKKRFARWEDVAGIDDLDAATVLYRAPVVDPDVLTVVHDFEEEGHFIGIVTARVAGDEQVYRAVFPFEVGYTGLGYWPFIVLLLVAIQLQYLVMSGRLKKWRARQAAAALAMLLVAPQSDAAGEEWVSERDIFAVTVESSLDPIEINRIHSWTLTLTHDGEPVEGAVFRVAGGMPAHDHGMPTAPRVTTELEHGRYLLEGMRFHMGGHWEVVIEIEADGIRDTVVISLEL